MEIEFANRRLARCFAQPDIAVRTWGYEVGRRYIQRVRTIARAKQFDELYTLPQLRLHLLRGDRSGLHAISLAGRWRLIVRYTDERAVIEEVSNHYDD